ncbi:hypothetical protein OWR29_36795 [Actinoplanes sp. Pm04-4]|uniref:Transmembrane protein n=1 Tax=Paractinoplanes pyxinae TaxID=2997416 RepID=A0ABT4BAR8_9ACTN|nr:hypothetical protein [Actinoplanes pyxinae]MCY1143591.1 hypothetical protein [Actinoplanes pyxinae]
MVSPKLDMQRAAGKLAIFLIGVYALVLFGLVVSTASGDPIPLVGWPIALVPAVAFVYSFVAAVRLHRTAEPDQTAVLWRRSLLYAVIGTVLAVAAVVIINRITPV